MPDRPAPIPAMIGHYAAYLRAWLHVTPETSVSGNRAEVRLRFGAKTFALIFGCRKKTWTLRHVEIRRGDQAATFTSGELAKAMAVLIGQEPMTPGPQAAKAHTRPRSDATLRERRTVVIRN